MLEEIVMPADLVGNISLGLSVTCLFFLVLGLPLIRGATSKRNLIRHGYLTIAALVLQTILVFVVMIPSLVEEFGEVLEFAPLFAFDTWLHVVTGVVAEVAGFAFVGLWLWGSVSNMKCVRAKRYMTPTFLVWIVAVVTGALVHLLDLI